MARRDRGDDGASNEEFEEIADALTSVHLPALAAEGLIEWDPETGTVRKGPEFDRIAPLIRRMKAREDSGWDEES